VSVPETVPVRRVELRRRALGERIGTWAWGLFGAGSAVTGLGFLASALLVRNGPMTGPIALTILVGIVPVYAWPLVLLAGVYVGRARTLAARAVHVVGRELAIEDETGVRLPFHGPYRQGAVARDGVVIEDAAGRELRATLDPAAAGVLIDALDLEPEKRRFTFRWQNTADRTKSWLAGFFGFGLLGGILNALVQASGVGMLAALGCMFFATPLLLTELTSRFWARRSLSVGLDGLEARSRRGTRWIRFADVAGIDDSDPTQLVVTLRDGTVHPLLADPGDPAERAAIGDRVREALAIARRKAGAASAASALLERAGRSLPEWRAAAARILTAATGFRDATVGAAELGAVLDDVSAPAE
jgi:hypothetical protein